MKTTKFKDMQWSLWDRWVLQGDLTVQARPLPCCFSCYRAGLLSLEVTSFEILSLVVTLSTLPHPTCSSRAAQARHIPTHSSLNHSRGEAQGCRLQACCMPRFCARPRQAAALVPLRGGRLLAVGLAACYAPHHVPAAYRSCGSHDLINITTHPGTTPLWWLLCTLRAWAAFLLGPTVDMPRLCCTTLEPITLLPHSSARQVSCAGGA